MRPPGCRERSVRRASGEPFEFATALLYRDSEGILNLARERASYAPNLDLIERFWHFMKRKVLFNRACAQVALFKQAFDDVFERLHAHEAALARLITNRFHLIGRPETGIPSA